MSADLWSKFLNNNGYIDGSIDDRRNKWLRSQFSNDSEGDDTSKEFTEFIASRYLLDPNEFVGWSSDGLMDQTMTVDLGNVGAGVSSRAGGLIYPFDVQLKRLKVEHYNSNAIAQAWGWRIIKQLKQENSTSVTSTDVLREVVGVGALGVAPRNYLNTSNQKTDIDLTNTDVIEAGTIITLGVEAPTAVTSNYYVQVMAGYLLLERVS